MQKIKNFVIYGERCSGTNFLEAIISGKSYFYNNEKKDKPNFYAEGEPAFNLTKTKNFGHKHFFGFNNTDIINNGDNTLFLGLARNPYDWMNSLFKKENLHHIPQHNWSYNNFFFNEWYSIDHDRFSENFMTERMDDRNFHTGERYKNIFELRKTKLDYLVHTMPRIAKNYVLIRYEDLCDDPTQIVKNISQKFDLDIINKDHVKTNRKYNNIYIKDHYSTITSNLDWNTESLLGYKSQKYQEPKTNRISIEEFYNKPLKDPDEFDEFDENFYSQTYTDTINFYQPFCKNNNISDKKRLYFHYKMHGKDKYANLNKMLSVCGIDLASIDKKNPCIEDILPVHNDFKDSYLYKTNLGKKITAKSDVVVVGLARNCGKQLQKSLDKILELQTNKLNLYIYENDSTDNSKQILVDYSKQKPNLTVSINNLDREHLTDKSNTRTLSLSEYRNHCLKWIKQNHSDSDFVIVLDFDADLGFSLEGIYNSIYWLHHINNAGGMGSYSTIINNNNDNVSFSHYDSFAIRLNDWLKNPETDIHNIWFRNFHPTIGSNPILFYSCFGGLGIYKTEAYLSGEYNNEYGCEHVGFHKSLKNNGWDMYLNPSSRFFSQCDISLNEYNT